MRRGFGHRWLEFLKARYGQQLSPGTLLIYYLWCCTHAVPASPGAKSVVKFTFYWPVVEISTYKLCESPAIQNSRYGHPENMLRLGTFGRG